MMTASTAVNTKIKKGVLNNSGELTNDPEIVTKQYNINHNSSLYIANIGNVVTWNNAILRISRIIKK